MQWLLIVRRENVGFHFQQFEDVHSVDCSIKHVGSCRMTSQQLLSTEYNIQSSIAYNNVEVNGGWNVGWNVGFV